MRNWSAECTELLIKHFHDGVSTRDSALLIYNATGVKFTKNAVIGRRNRVGLCRNTKERSTILAPRTIARQRAKEAEREAGLLKREQLERHKKDKAEAEVELLARKSTEAGTQASLRHCYTTYTRDAVLGLQANSCRYPIGEVGHEDFHFCCEPKDDDSSYCTKHRALCTVFVPIKISELARL
jgi:GcrA cell cycle regulator